MTWNDNKVGYILIWILIIQNLIYGTYFGLREPNSPIFIFLIAAWLLFFFWARTYSGLMEKGKLIFFIFY